MPGRMSSYRAYYVGEIQGQTSQLHVAKSHGRNLTCTGIGRQNWQPDTYPLMGKSELLMNYMHR